MSLTRSYYLNQTRGDMLPVPIAPASTFKLGDLLTLDTSGRLQQIIAASTAYTTQLIAGIATGNALNDQGALYPSQVPIVWDSNLRLFLPLYSGTPANAVFNPNMLGNKCGLYNTASGFPAVNFDDTTNTYVRIVGVLESDYPGWPTYNGAGTSQFPFVEVVPLQVEALLSGGR